MGVSLCEGLGMTSGRVRHPAPLEADEPSDGASERGSEVGSS